jgi:transposase InsO family protein
MSRKGNCWDKACAESFFKTLKRELETLDGNHSAGEVRHSGIIRVSNPPSISFFYPSRLFQNFSFWNSYLEFRGKTGFSTGFPKSLSKTNRVLEQAPFSTPFLTRSPCNSPLESFFGAGLSYINEQ